MLKKISTILTTVLLATLCIAGRAFSATYTIDPNHSTVGFAVKHLQVSTVRGGFVDYAGEITFDAKDLKVFKADLTIQSKSINTGNENRDNHLRSADFFDVAQFPTITFASTRIAETADGYSILGDLTMHGVTKSIAIPVTISGPVNNPMGGTVIGIAGKAVVNRQDFGIAWNKTMDNGGFVVGNVVDIVIEFEAHAK